MVWQLQCRLHRQYIQYSGQRYISHFESDHQGAIRGKIHAQPFHRIPRSVQNQRRGIHPIHHMNKHMVWVHILLGDGILVLDEVVGEVEGHVAHDILDVVGQQEQPK